MKARQDTTKDESMSPCPALQQKVNHNGFTNSPPFTQIMPPVLVILALVLTFVSVNVHFSGERLQIAMDLLLLVNCGLMVWLWYMSTSIVPTDGVQLRHLAAIQQGEEFDHSNLTYFCHTCKTYINNNCFHCKRCRRCVQFFDHHCKWLNNCIGAKNYFEFYGLILATFILLGMCIGLSATCLSQKDRKEERLVEVCSIITILVSTVPSCWLMYLICLHTYLIITKKSTIQLILESRSKHKITPKNSINDQVFKVSFSKNSTDPAVKKVVFPQRDEEMESSHNETNHNLIRPKDRSIIDCLDNKDSRSLPPLKGKINVSFVDSRISKSLTPFALAPPSIKR